MPRFLWQQVAGLARTQSCAPKCELLLDCGAFSPETQVEVAMNRKRCKTQAKKFRCHEEGNIQVAMMPDHRIADQLFCRVIMRIISTKPEIDPRIMPTRNSQRVCSQ